MIRNTKLAAEKAAKRAAHMASNPKKQLSHSQKRQMEIAIAAKKANKLIVKASRRDANEERRVNNLSKRTIIDL